MALLNTVFFAPEGRMLKHEGVQRTKMLFRAMRGRAFEQRSGAPRILSNLPAGQVEMSFPLNLVVGDIFGHFEGSVPAFTFYAPKPRCV